LRADFGEWVCVVNLEQNGYMDPRFECLEVEFCLSLLTDLIAVYNFKAASAYCLLGRILTAKRNFFPPLIALAFMDGGKHT
jgi:hypothetical protein